MLIWRIFWLRYVLQKPEIVTSSRKYRVRVLVCAPSNSALDEIVLRLLNTGTSIYAMHVIIPPRFSCFCYHLCLDAFWFSSYKFYNFFSLVSWFEEKESNKKQNRIVRDWDALVLEINCVTMSLHFKVFHCWFGSGRTTTNLWQCESEQLSISLPENTHIMLTQSLEWLLESPSLGFFCN